MARDGAKGEVPHAPCIEKALVARRTQCEPPNSNRWANKPLGSQSKVNVEKLRWVTRRDVDAQTFAIALPALAVSTHRMYTERLSKLSL